MKFAHPLWVAASLMLATPAVAPAASPARAPATVRLELGPAVTMEFIRVEPGTFAMGTDANWGDGDETPRHDVTLTRAFYLGRTEVTQQQWRAVMPENPSRFRGRDLPVEQVSWLDCQRFLGAVRRATGREVALPTEAQWEFACRAGTSTRWYFGDDERGLDAVAWVGATAGGRTHPVGARPPNPWGLSDLYGNVWDWYASHYPAGPAVDPTGPLTGDARVLRGGAWGDSAAEARSGYRNSMAPDARTPGSGFRCALSEAEALKLLVLTSRQP